MDTKPWYLNERQIQIIVGSLYAYLYGGVEIERLPDNHEVESLLWLFDKRIELDD